MRSNFTPCKTCENKAIKGDKVASHKRVSQNHLQNLILETNQEGEKNTIELYKSLFERSSERWQNEYD